MESTQAEKINFISRFIRGGYSLGISFWAFGLGVTGAAYILGVVLGRIFGSTQFFISAIILLCMAELIAKFILIIGIWRSGQRYSGPRIWIFLSRVFAIILFASTLMWYGFIFSNLKF